MTKKQRERRAKLLWVTKDGKRRIDELCTCGKMRSQYADLYGGAVIGHGQCEVAGSSCMKFTWASMVFEP
jgi:hypothetical protein